MEMSTMLCQCYSWYFRYASAESTDPWHSSNVILSKPDDWHSYGTTFHMVILRPQILAPWRLRWFSPGTLASSHIPCKLGIRLSGHSRLPIGMKVSVDVSLSQYVSPKNAWCVYVGMYNIGNKPCIYCFKKLERYKAETCACRDE